MKTTLPQCYMCSHVLIVFHSSIESVCRLLCSVFTESYIACCSVQSWTVCCVFCVCALFLYVWICLFAFFLFSFILFFVWFVFYASLCFSFHSFVCVIILCVQRCCYFVVYFFFPSTHSFLFDSHSFCVNCLLFCALYVFASHVVSLYSRTIFWPHPTQPTQRQIICENSVFIVETKLLSSQRHKFLSYAKQYYYYFRYFHFISIIVQLFLFFLFAKKITLDFAFEKSHFSQPKQFELKFWKRLKFHDILF